MFKKFGVGLLVAFQALLFCQPALAADNRDIVQTAQSMGYDISEEQRPASFIVVDGQTGNILWGDQVDLVRDPASMSKLMAIYLVYEAMEEMGFDETTTIRATKTDAAVSQIYEISNNKIISGVDYPIGDLITAALVKSSNAAVFMLTNYISDNKHSNFVDQMNIKARELGMVNTHFYNSSGAVARAYDNYYLPDRYDINTTNVTTAKDLAILAYHLLKEHPQIIDHTDDYEVTIMAGTKYEEHFQAYNHSLPGGEYELDGVNGLKTGSSPSAQFNSVISAQRGDQSIITVVMGVGDWYDEHSEDYRQIFVNTLVSQGFEDARKEDNTPGSSAYDSILSSQQPQLKPAQPANFQLLEDWAQSIKPILLGLAALGLLAFTALLVKEINNG